MAHMAQMAEAKFTLLKWLGWLCGALATELICAPAVLLVTLVATMSTLSFYAILRVGKYVFAAAQT